MNKHIKKKKIKAQIEVHQVSTDYFFNKVYNYLNVSFNICNAGLAPDAQLEVHLPHKQGLHRLLGSIPSWGGPAL